jgi:hypothetical protein
MLQHYYALSGVPWLLAESMGFRSNINLSGNPNTLGMSTHYALTVHSICTHYALTMHSLYAPTVLTIQ